MARTEASVSSVLSLVAAPVPAEPLSPPHLPLELVLHIISLLDPTHPAQRHTLALFAASSHQCRVVAERTLYRKLSLDGRDMLSLADADAAVLAARRCKLATTRFVRIVAPLSLEQLHALYTLARDGNGHLPSALFAGATDVHLADTRQVLAARQARPGSIPPADVLLFTSPRICVDGAASHTLLKYLPCLHPLHITSHLPLSASPNALQDLVPTWETYTVFDDCAPSDHEPQSRSVKFMSRIVAATRRDLSPIELRWRAQPRTAARLAKEWHDGGPGFTLRFYTAAEVAQAADGCTVCGECSVRCVLTEGMTWAAERPLWWQATAQDGAAWSGPPPVTVGRAQFAERVAKWSAWGME
ncbi:uncharacterized protein LOC62_01G000106 [Vanrija pseudolonga]|uniref:F-box domain-containing protein n=1 Tax=Vanrija pseudolonga TaxID=143232 RepID=A0AAF0Y2R3_9TREE|nr:hypothetical protein LOC62_01G000106 [Vanrija pseudolonga]